MEKTTLLLSAAGALVLLALAFFLLQGISLPAPPADCGSLKTAAEKADCYHALAHASANRSVCGELPDGEEKAHCLAHVAEVGS